jgi:hypothetical protein
MLLNSKIPPTRFIILKLRFILLIKNFRAKFIFNALIPLYHEFIIKIIANMHSNQTLINLFYDLLIVISFLCLLIVYATIEIIITNSQFLQIVHLFLKFTATLTLKILYYFLSIHPAMHLFQI